MLFVSRLRKPAPDQRWARVMIGRDGKWVEFFKTKKAAQERARYQFTSDFREDGDVVYVVRVELVGAVSGRRVR